jgi:hypothetical protein
MTRIPRLPRRRTVPPTLARFAADAWAFLRLATS